MHQLGLNIRSTGAKSSQWMLWHFHCCTISLYCGRQSTAVHVVCQESCTEFTRIRAQSSSPNPREKQLRDLAMAYDTFMDLKNNIEEGAQVCETECRKLARHDLGHVRFFSCVRTLMSLMTREKGASRSVGQCVRCWSFWGTYDHYNFNLLIRKSWNNSYVVAVLALRYHAGLSQLGYSTLGSVSAGMDEHFWMGKSPGHRGRHPGLPLFSVKCGTDEINGHMKTAEQQIIIWWLVHWPSMGGLLYLEGPGWAALHPAPSSLYQM